MDQFQCHFNYHGHPRYHGANYCNRVLLEVSAGEHFLAKGYPGLEMAGWLPQVPI